MLVYVCAPFGGQFPYYFIEKIACAASVRGGNAPYITETEGIELIGVEHLCSGIDLVDRDDYRLAGPAENVGYFIVIVRYPRSGLCHEKYQIRLFDGHYYLFADFRLEDILRI